MHFEDLAPTVRDGFWHFATGERVPVVSGASGPPAAVDPAPPPADPAPAGDPASAPPAPAPAPAPEPTLDDAAAAMRARLLGSDDPEAILPDNAPYRDAKGVRDDIAKIRTEYGPMAEAFGGMDAEARAALLGAVPELGADLATVAGAFSSLPPADKQVILQIVAMLPEDPRRAAELFGEAATILSGGDPEAAPGGAPSAGAAGEVDDDEDLLEALGFEKDDPNRPITRAELDAWAQDRDQQAELRRLEQQTYDQIRSDARELGYDPDANPKTPEGRTARARAGLLFNLMNLYGSDDPEAMAKAHADITAMDQAQIDQYVQGKKADADRPQPPSGGAPPNDGRVLESLDDGAAAMRERLDSRGIGRR